MLALSCAVERWINVREATGGWCQRTAANVRGIWRRYLVLLGDRDLRRISSAEIEDLFLDSRQRGAGWANYRRCAVSGLFAWAFRHGWIRRDPTVDAWPRLPETGEPVFRTVSREEEAALCRHLRAPLVRYVVVAIATGLRRGTMYALDWSMVTRDWVVSIPARALKNRRSIRIPLNSRAILALGRRRASGPLLPGLPCRTKINGRLQRAARRARLPQPHLVRTHQFRRTWVERFRDAGGTREECQLVQGWASSSVLLSRYWPRVPEARAREILERI